MVQASTGLSRLPCVIALCAGHLLSTAHAVEGGLILPSQGESRVVLELERETTDIEPAKVLQVYAGKSEACCKEKLPVAGGYTVSGRALTFVPSFEFIEGQGYTVLVQTIDGTGRVVRSVTDFAIERTLENTSAEIVAIYPSGNEIPANTLRFYLHFSKPVRPHVSGDFIRLVDATGTHDTEAFMAFKQELWSEDRKRLTLLMDPGRIKRGVAQNRMLGPALQEGEHYSIVVDKGWPAANDSESMPGYVKRYSVTEALRTLPDPQQWNISSPRINSQDPLLIEFDRPFDRELLLHGIALLDNTGRLIPGVKSVGMHERSWRFDREGIWRNSTIQLAIDTRLEDVAGNNLVDLLDHDVGTVAPNTTQQIVTLNIEPSSFKRD